MKIDMRKRILSIIETNERKRMLHFKLTSIDVLKQMFIVKIEKEFDEEETLQTIINEDVEKKSKKRR
jgi:peptide deformylase